MRRLAFCVSIALSLAVLSGSTAWAQSRSFNFLTTGNGHGFQVYDRTQHRITQFLEHPYRFVASGADDRTWGVGRRDLAHDIYFGVRVGSATTWLHDQPSVEYEQQSHIIHARSTQSGIDTDTYYFAPWGYGGNGMVMAIHAHNGGGAPANVSFYAKPNMQLGTGTERTTPGADNEQIAWNTTPIAHGTETGPWGGHVVVVPIGGTSHAGCGEDSALYDRAVSTGNVGDTASCNGFNQVLALQQEATIAAGGDAWWGVAVLFVNDNPTDARASLFRDDRSVADTVVAWQAFAGDKDAETLHQEALDELEAWRTPPPSGLSPVENTLWRQSEVVMRMGQVLEPRQANRENHGMMLAALAPGEWHTGWVRDAAYAIFANAMIGHFAEARLGVEFLLGADGATNGFFSNAAYLNNGSYRVSATRYLGNGDEEGDWNSDGPNVETDGWGLTLWAARAYIHQSCDKGWLDTLTWRGDTVFEGLHAVAQDIEGLVRSGLPAPDTSIWEVHWNYRQVFAFTAASHIRGLYDFADIAEWYGRMDLATHFREVATTMLEAVRSTMVYVPDQSIASNLNRAGSPVHVDASTVEFLTWGLIGTDDPIYMGTLNNYSRLMTGFGGYARVESTLALAGMRNDTYDTNEWILIDLRIGQAWRNLGRTDRADPLLDKVTQHATVNDFMIPELFDKNTGGYQGVVPMVGYGAGAWMTSQLDKHGVSAPAHDAGFGHCPVDGVDAGRPPVPDGGYVAADGGFGGGSDGGAPIEDGSASFCAVASRSASPGLPGFALAIAFAWILRRRVGR